MLPFFPFNANHGHNQQVNGNPNNGMPTQGQSQNTAPYNNPNFFTGHGNQGSMQTNGAFGIQNPNALGALGNVLAQNLLSGLLTNGSMNGVNPNAGLVNAQLALQSQLQNVNQLLTMALTNQAQLGSFNPMAGHMNPVGQGGFPQNGALNGNLQPGVLQPNGVRPQVNLNQQNSFNPMVNGHVPNGPNQLPAPNHQMQMKSFVPSGSGASMPRTSQAMGSPQGNQANRDRMSTTPNQRQNRPFNRDHKGGGSNWRDRPQNANNQYPRKMNGRQNFPKESRQKGNIRDDGAEPLNDSKNDSNGGKRRLPMMQYSDKEIQQWREARRKFYPTKANVQKKQLRDGKRSGDADQEAELRRQQLKNILAKQAELGFEVPEIPPHYLTESESKQLGNNQTKRPFKQNDRFQNRPNPKRTKFDQNKHKQHRQNNDNATWNNEVNARKPTLLEKLLTSDVKRDRCHLLQAFRFMAMNSFFDDDSKALEFPKVFVKDASSQGDDDVKIEELIGVSEEVCDDGAVKGEAEEGEVTD